MNTIDAKNFLNTGRLPARLNVEQTACLLGFQPHDINTLVSADMLKPLGKPAGNAPKYFAATEITEHTGNTAWLSKATIKVSEHWAKKNAKRLSVD